MDNPQNPQNPAPSNTTPADVVSELEHVTAEIYKKNAELTYTNKTLTILQKVTAIILSNVTDPKQVAQKVADLIIPVAQYKGASILLVDNDSNSLIRIGVSDSPEIQKGEEAMQKKVFDIKTPLNAFNNIIVKAINEKKIQVTGNVYDLYLPAVSQEQATQFQKIVGIQSVVIYPLITRDQVLGAMCISRFEDLQSLNPYDYDLMNRLVGLVAVALDNAILYKEIQAANEKLKQLDKLKDEFVSLASHELRTPLTAIKSYLWLALNGKGGPLSEKQKYYLDRSYSSADRLSNLVDEMLNVSRIESGRITIDKKQLLLPDLVKDVIAELAPRAQQLGVTISVIDNPQMVPVMADGDKIKQVLINIMGNSLKFTPANGSITISFDVKDGFVTTHIADTGKGIAAQDIPKLFEKFGILQGTYESLMTTQGTGLGLYITKSIIGLHGGKIWAESPGPMKGSTFTFTLPIG